MATTPDLRIFKDEDFRTVEVTPQGLDAMPLWSRIFVDSRPVLQKQEDGWKVYRNDVRRTQEETSAWLVSYAREYAVNPNFWEAALALAEAEASARPEFGSEAEWVQGAFILSNGGKDRRDKSANRRLARAECVLAARIIAMDNAPAPALAEQVATEEALTEFRDAFVSLVRGEE